MPVYQVSGLVVCPICKFSLAYHIITTVLHKNLKGWFSIGVPGPWFFPIMLELVVLGSIPGLSVLSVWFPPPTVQRHVSWCQMGYAPAPHPLRPLVGQHRKWMYYARVICLNHFFALKTTVYTSFGAIKNDNWVKP